MSQASDIVLVAGGIGITPMMSLLRQLCHIYAIRSSSDSASSRNLPQLPPIALVWTVRQGFLLALFCDQLTEVLQKHFPLSPITIKIYYTASKSDLSPEVSLKLNSVISFGGRPDLEHIFSEFKKRSLLRNSEPCAVHAIACGPETLISGVQNHWCDCAFPNLVLPPYPSLPHSIQPEERIHIFQRGLLLLKALSALHSVCTCYSRLIHKFLVPESNRPFALRTCLYPLQHIA